MDSLVVLVGKFEMLGKIALIKKKRRIGGSGSLEIENGGVFVSLIGKAGAETV